MILNGNTSNKVEDLICTHMEKLQADQESKDAIGLKETLYGMNQSPN